LRGSSLTVHSHLPACLVAIAIACGDSGDGSAIVASPRPPAALDKEADVPAYALPSLEPMIDHLRRQRWRIETPGAREAARRTFDIPSPALRRDDRAEALVRTAIEQLVETLASAPAIAPHLGPALDRSPAMGIVVDEEPESVLRYDGLHDVLKVPRCTLDFPPRLLALVVSHELMHAADHLVIAAGLDLDPEGTALLQDIVGMDALAGERTRLEERACRIELQVAYALGIEIRPPAGPPRRVRGCLMTADHLMHTLVAYEAAEAGPPGTWERMLQGSPAAEALGLKASAPADGGQ
jgi:hypothetical protein